jgi:phenylacetate-CoA ligase
MNESMSRVLTRGYYRFRAPGALSELKALERSQWSSADELRAQQAERLRRTLRHAFLHVPYYRDTLAKLGGKPEDFQTVEDLRALPVLSRSTLRAEGARLIDERVDPTRLLRNATGGSTGAPVTFHQDRAYWRVGFASMWRAWFLFPGYDLGVRSARFWGADRDEPHQLLRTIGRVFFNQVFLNSFQATETSLRDTLDRIERFAPRLLIAYASSAELLARQARITGRRITIPSVVSSAESLSAEQRALLEETFGARVHDCYGCREVGAIAQQCAEGGGLHINVETQVVELEPVDPAHPRGPQRLLVTHLWNDAMPLIRYDLGDTVPAGSLRWDPCACGRTLPRMPPVAGRVSDIIRSPKGAFVHGEYFTHLFYGQSEIAQFQVHQTDLDRLILRVVPTERLEEQVIERVKSQIMSDHGFTRIDVESCAAIAPEPSGKLRFTRSDLDPRGASHG